MLSGALNQLPITKFMVMVGFELWSKPCHSVAGWADNLPRGSTVTPTLRYTHCTICTLFIVQVHMKTASQQHVTMHILVTSCRGYESVACVISICLVFIAIYAKGVNNICLSDTLCIVKPTMTPTHHLHIWNSNTWNSDSYCYCWALDKSVHLNSE